ncbi:exocyst complex component Sec10-like protein [Gorgonomyces haynaldii]|nr:exocyst complex component Sec10-like protein [Gorgonomyces haynaldii]
MSKSDGNYKDVLRVENFKGKFVAREFIESQCGRLTEQLKNQEFDPKPFIRTFESLTEELLRLKRKLQSKIEDQEDQQQALENASKSKIKDFGDMLDSVNREFESLDSRLTEVGNTAIRIGEQLETIDKHRTKAAEAKDVIQYFSEFNQGSFQRLDTLRRSSRDGEYKAAIIARRLNAIAKEVDVPGTENARSNIEKYCENLEKSLLEAFDTAYSQGDIDTMNHVATTLIDFNGGNSVIQAYVAQHAFFINLLKIAQQEQEAFSENMRTKENTRDGLMRLYDEIKQAVTNEWDAIYRIFPNPLSVMQVFLQRIFAQSIQNFLEIILQQVPQDRKLDFLESLEIAHSETFKLVSDLHKFDETKVTSDMGSSSLTLIINRSFEDLFVPYIDGDRYISTEREWMQENFQICLEPFNAFLQYRQKALKKFGKSAQLSSPLKTTPPAGNVMMASMFNTLQTTMNTVSQMSAELSNQLNAPVTPISNPMDPDANGCPTFQTASKMIEYNAMSINRAKQLSHPQDQPTDICRLFKDLIEHLGNQYLEIALDNTIEDLGHQDAKAEPHFDHLIVAKIVNQTIQLIQVHFRAAVLPHLLNSPTIYREIVNYKNDFLSRVEIKLNTILSTDLSNVKNWLEGLLGKLKKTDFKPKDESVILNTTCTPTCEKVCQFLVHIKEAADSALEGRNHDIYLTEVGTSLFTMLADQMKRYPVNYAGGCQWTTDLSKYHEAIAHFNVETLNEEFDILKELGNLFIVKPENLKAVIREGHLARLEFEVLQPYLVLRPDWSKLSKIEKDLFKI